MIINQEKLFNLVYRYLLMLWSSRRYSVWYRQFLVKIAYLCKLLLVPMTLAALSTSAWADTCGSDRFGPNSEIRHSIKTHPGAIVLNQNDNWESQIERGSNGQVFLLDSSAGNTFKVETLTFDDVEVYPNDCDKIKIDANRAIELGSRAVLAGFELDLTDSSGGCVEVSNQKWNGRSVQNATIRGNYIYGGEGNCIRIYGKTNNIKVLNNHINGGFGNYGLTIAVRGDGAYTSCNGDSPQDTLIENNLLEKNQKDFPGGSAGIPQGSPEDHVTFAASGDVIFRRNILRNQSDDFNGEEYMDLKYGCDGGIYTIERNFFYGPTHRESTQGCFLAQTETHAKGTKTHIRLRGNIFYRCNAWNNDKDAVRFGAKSPDVFLGDIIGNLIIMDNSSQAEAIRIADTEKINIEYNTIHRGKFVISSGNNQTQDTRIDKFRNNLFVDIDFDLNTKPYISDCTHQAKADGTSSLPSDCSNTATNSPQFLNSNGSCDKNGNCTIDYTPTSSSYLAQLGSDDLPRGVFVPPTIASAEATGPNTIVIKMDIPRRNEVGTNNIAKVDPSKIALQTGGSAVGIANATRLGEVITLTTIQTINKTDQLTLKTQDGWCHNDLDLGGVGVGASCLGVTARAITNNVERNISTSQILPPVQLRINPQK